MSSQVDSQQFMHTLRFFKQLPGAWAVHRSIPNQGTTRGTARFEEHKEDPNSLYYHEKGALMLESGREIPCYRDYIYRYLQQTDSINIFLLGNGQEDQLLHTLKFMLGRGTTIASHQHHCKKDVYDVIYSFVEEKEQLEQFTVSYSVQGPAKNYQLRTIFKRNRSFTKNCPPQCCGLISPDTLSGTGKLNHSRIRWTLS